MPDLKVSFNRGQQLSDRLASRVSKGKLSFNQAMAIQKQEDAEVIRNASGGVAENTRASSQGLASKRKFKKAKFKLDNNGNLVAF